MERLASSAATTSYVSWEEVFVSSDKGRREVHYFLKRKVGGSDLAVVGKEKTLRHMSYHYAIRDPSLGPFWKLKSRREVVDWLDSIVSDLDDVPDDAVAMMTRKQNCGPEIETLKLKDNQSQKLRHGMKEFTWLGSPWTCRKRRKHYQAYKRNGVQISVYDFVFVLAEEHKRLVAYLEDLYEDSRGNKMVVVRWFHKIDEVGIDLPHSFSDREVFFSLYLQDLSIECIDGLATVLSPQHYKKFQSEASHAHLKPFVCHRQFDNDDVKSFDITLIKGYWKQEMLRYMYTHSDSKSNGSSGLSDDGPELEQNPQCTNGVRPKKRRRYLKVDVDDNDDCDLAPPKLENLSNTKINTKVSTGNNTIKLVGSTTEKGMNGQASQYLIIGSQVEILSQDSGMRGCWFKASIIKKHKDKVKVQYLDLEDAVDESKKLEEWILASRIAVPDDLGLRINGRPKIRPAPESSKCEISWVGDVGDVVDAWWHDGWWEGIVVQKESEACYHVYFTGEKLVSTFGPCNLRKSQDWSGNQWVTVRERPDLVTSVLSSLKTKQDPSKSNDSKSTVASTGEGVQSKQADTCVNSKRNKPRYHVAIADEFLKDDLLSQLSWKSSKKRRHRSGGSSCPKTWFSDSKRKKSSKLPGPDASDSYVMQTTLKVDHDDCKYGGGDPSIFSSSVVPSLTNLVMCR